MVGRGGSIMSKRKKRVVSMMMAFVVLVGSSLAIFTDRKEAFVEGEAGTVKLGEVAKPSTNLKNMKPGEARTFTLESKYDGSLDAVGTITIADKNSSGKGKMHNSGATGFVLKNGANVIQFSGGKATINKGTLKPGTTMKQEFILELGKDAPDTMQGVAADLEFVFEAKQAD